VEDWPLGGGSWGGVSFVHHTPSFVFISLFAFKSVFRIWDKQTIQATTPYFSRECFSLKKSIKKEKKDFTYFML
jgi:hypothetical protein